MQTPAKLSFAISWSHHRNAKLCFNNFININCGQIVAFSILAKFFNYNFLNSKRTSRNLEARFFELILPYFTKLGKLGTIIKDNNFKIDKFIKNHNWTANVMSNINHKFKNFRIFAANVQWFYQKWNNKLQWKFPFC